MTQEELNKIKDQVRKDTAEQTLKFLQENGVNIRPTIPYGYFKDANYNADLAEQYKQQHNQELRKKYPGIHPDFP